MKGRGEYHEELAKETEYKILENIGVKGATWAQLLKRTGLSKSTLSKTLHRLIAKGILEKRIPPYGTRKPKKMGDFVEEGKAWELREWLKYNVDARPLRLGDKTKRRAAILRSYGHFQPKHIKRKGESQREYLRRIRRETKPRYMFKLPVLTEKERAEEAPISSS